MSALEKALRQIDAEQQQSPWLDDPYGTPWPAKARGDRHWLAMLILLAIMGMLAMAWYWFGNDSRLLLRFPIASVSPAPVEQSPAEQKAASAPALVAKAEPMASAGTPTHPAPAAPQLGWHDGGEQLWRSGHHSEAARMWLQALRQLPSEIMVLPMAQLQLYPQANALKQRWGSQYPVLVLAAPPLGSRKRWSVLAVPSPSQLQQAQLQLSVAQRELLPLQTLAQWLASHSGQSTPATPLANDAPVNPAPSRMAAPLTPLPVAPRTAAPSASAPHLPPAPALALPVPAGIGSSAKATRSAGASMPAALPAPAPGAPASAASAESVSVPPSASVAAAQDTAAALPGGPPEAELQRVAPDKVAGNLAASAVAKSIEIDYQAIEKMLARGEGPSAVEAAQKLEKSIGENWRTRFLFGVAQLVSGRLEEASTALTRAQQLNPGHLLSAVYLAVALQERGEHGKAIGLVRKALDKHPNSPELWLNLGHSSQATGQSAEARKAYQQFMALSVSRQDLAAQRSWVQAWLQKDN